MSDITCPFCGLLCDDLSVDVAGQQLRILANGCDLSERGFAGACDGKASAQSPEAWVDGDPATRAEAISAAARLIGASNAPLVSGLATDVNGARAAVTLAERAGAIIDHANSQHLMRNMRVLQDSGWVTGTFTEIRNRADLIIVLGQRVLERFPRLCERVLTPEGALFEDSRKARRLLFVGATPESGVLPERAEAISAEPEQLADLFAALRARLASASSERAPVGLAPSRLDALAEQLKAARYSAFIWAASDLALPHAELTVQALTSLVSDLNATTRSVGLPLAGSEGDLSANHVCLWRTGYPLRTSFQRAQPTHEPLLYAHSRLLAEAEVDLLLWVAAITPSLTPPPTPIPTIVIGHPALALDRTPAVFIRAGVPGIDHAGHLYRGDSVVSLPLRKLRDGGHPPASEILTAICARLDAGA